jgi:hypothetical protein
METNELDIENLRAVLILVRGGWGEGGRELDCRVCYALGMNWINPEYTDSGAISWRGHINKFGFTAAWVSDHVYDYDIPRVTTSLDAVYKLISNYLPHHDAIGVDRDPSGMGGYVGNWALSHPEGPQIMEYARASHGTEVMALLTAFLTALINKLADTSESEEEYKARRARRDYEPA